MSNPLKGSSILYVDDSQDERELFAVRFELLGAYVHTVGTASKALESLTTTPIDLLISDILLDGEDGYELIRSVRSLPPAEGGLIPAVAVSGLVRDSDRAKAIKAGFDRHIAKPYDVDAVVRAAADLAELIERLRDYRAIIQATRHKTQLVFEQLGRRQVSLTRQRERHLERVLEARKRLSRSVDVIRSAEAYLRERDDLGPIDQLNVGQPVRIGDEEEVWFVTVVANSRRLLVEVKIDPQGTPSTRELGRR